MNGFCLPPLSSLLLLSAVAAAAAPDPAAACRATRDAALARLAADENGFRAMLDADAAVLDSPTYELSETERTLMADVAAARARVEAKYRACLATGSGRKR